MPRYHKFVINIRYCVLTASDNMKPQANQVDVSVLPSTSVTVEDQLVASLSISFKCERMQDPTS